MTTFIDTSAFIALLIAEDINHRSAAKIWKDLIQRDDLLVTSNYVIVETLALLHRRSGLPAVRIFLEDILPLISTEWVDENLHTAGANSLLLSSKQGPNIVDCVNFALMRQAGVKAAFTFDAHFKTQGFTVLK